MLSLLYTLSSVENLAVNQLPVGSFDLSGVLPGIMSMIIGLLRWVLYQLDGIKLYRDNYGLTVSILDLYIVITIITIIIDLLFVTWGPSSPSDYTE